jgi:raffinose/stachyose/melibiose transport system substrate-binding protein
MKEHVMKNATKRSWKTIAVGISVVSAIALAGCSGSGASTGDSSSSANEFKVPATKKGTLTMITKYGNAKYQPYFNSIVAGYEKANPGVKIDMQAVGDQAYKDKIKVLASSKQLPDIYFAWPGAFGQQFIDAGYAADLSPVLKGTKWGDSFAPAALSALQSKGKDYGVPLTLDSKVWVYNKEAFDKAGISVPKSYSDLVADCGKLSAAGYTPIGFGNQDGWPAVQYLTQLNPQEVPAKTLAADYSGSDPKYTDAGYVKALKAFQDLNSTCMTSGSNAVSDTTATADFTNGKAAMYYAESLSFGMFTEAGGAPAGFENKWGLFRMPSIAGAQGDQQTLAGAPDGLMVNSSSPNKGLAVDFLKYMTSKANGTKMLSELGWLSSVKGTVAAADTIPQQQEVADLIAKAPSMAIWLDTVTPADVSQAYLSGVEGMLDGSKTPAEVMQAVQTAAKSQ